MIDFKIKPGIIAFGIFFLSLALTRLPSSIHVLGLSNLSACRIAGTPWYAEPETADFQPKYFTAYIEPYSRLASDMATFYAEDLKGIYYKIFGSTERAVVADRSLAGYLLKEDLVDIDDPAGGAYHFKSSGDKEKLSDLGIKYIMRNGRSTELETQGWQILAQYFSLFLYKNPQKVGLVYYWDAGKRVVIPEETINFKGNGLIIPLPVIQEKKELVATFSLRWGWKARLDGKEKPIKMGENHMMRVDIEPGDRVLNLQYEPFKPYHFLLAIASSIIILAGGWIFMSRRGAFHE